VGHMKSPRGPHVARGPRVGQHWSKVFLFIYLNVW